MEKYDQYSSKKFQLLNAQSILKAIDDCLSLKTNCQQAKIQKICKKIQKLVLSKYEELISQSSNESQYQNILDKVSAASCLQDIFSSTILIPQHNLDNLLRNELQQDMFRHIQIQILHILESKAQMKEIYLKEKDKHMSSLEKLFCSYEFQLEAYTIFLKQNGFQKPQELFNLAWWKTNEKVKFIFDQLTADISALEKLRLFKEILELAQDNNIQQAFQGVQSTMYCGNVLVLSQLKAYLQDILKSNSDINLFAFKYLYIDVDLTEEIFKGKNITMVCNGIIEVTKQATIDVSGLNAYIIHMPKAANGSTAGQSGQNGEDGYCGHSGGNIYIQCKAFKRESLLTIKSCGGNGGNGQDGGDGADGKHGEDGANGDIDESKWPDCGVFAGVTAGKNFQIIMNNMKEICPDFETYQYINYLNQQCDGSTKDGRKLLAILYFFFRRSALFLHKGAMGKEGGNGGNAGNGGVSGKGGFQGSITIFPNDSQIKLIAYNGDEGMNGKPGRAGKGGLGGKQGIDAGWYGLMSCATVKYHGRLELRNTNGNQDEEVYSHKQKKYLKIYQSKSPNNCTERATEGKQGNNGKTFSTEAKYPSKQKAIIISEVQKQFNEIFKVQMIQSKDQNFQISEKIFQVNQFMQENQESQVQQTYIKENTRDIYQMRYQSKNKKAVIIDSYDLNFLFIDSDINDIKIKNETRFSQFDEILKLCDKDNDFKNYEAKRNFFATINKIVQGITLKHKKTQNYDIQDLKFEDFNLLRVPNDGNCGIHSIFGSKNLGYVQEINASNIRKDAAIQISKLDMHSKVIQSIKESIKVYMTEKGQHSVNNQLKRLCALQKQYVNFINESNNKLNLLWNKIEELIINNFQVLEILYDCDNKNMTIKKAWFQKIDSNSSFYKHKSIPNIIQKHWKEFNDTSKIEFDWESCIKKEEIQEYCYLLQDDSLFLLQTDLAAIAAIYDMNLVVCNIDQSTNQITYKISYNDSCSNVKFIAFNGINHYEYLELKPTFFADQIEQIHSLLTIMSLSKILSIQNINISKSQSSIYQLKQELTSYAQINLNNEDESIDYYERFVVTFSNMVYNEYLGKIISAINLLRMFFKGQTINILINILLEQLEFVGLLINEQDLFWLLNDIIESLKLSNDQQPFMIYSSLFSTLLIYPQQQWIKMYILKRFDYYLQFSQCSNSKKILEKFESINNIEFLILLYKNVRILDIQMIDLKNLTYVIKTINETSHVETLLKVLEDSTLDKWKYDIENLLLILELKQIILKQKFEIKQNSIYRYIHQISEMSRKYSVNQVMKLLHVLSEIKFANEEEMMEIFYKFYSEQWEIEMCGKLNSFSKEKWGLVFKKSQIERTYKDLLNIMIKDSDNSLTMVDYLRIEELVKIVKQDLEYMHQDFNNQFKSFQKKEPQCKKEYFFKLFLQKIYDLKSLEINKQLSIISIALCISNGILPRDTQLLSICFFCYKHEKGMFQQISTGEGKSYIVAILSILKVMQGKKVDILTSSLVLAKRDAQDNEKLFSLFGITCSHNCSESIEDRQIAYQKDIVYGETGAFQRDILLDEFYGKSIRGNRKCECLIVDEVDSLFLDKGSSMLYLSHQIPRMNFLEGIYVNIWKCVNANGTDYSDKNIDQIKKMILDMTYGVITEYSFKDFKNITADQCLCLVQTLQQKGIIDQYGLIIKDLPLSKDLGVDLNQYILPIRLTLDQVKKKEIQIKVPLSFKQFVLDSLDQWIKSAFQAKYMIENDQYIITQKMNLDDVNITIIDNETGVEQYHSEWSNGLQQFLQLKHCRKLSAETLKAVFISNISYFKRYGKMLYGLTGTLGTQIERDTLKQIYQCEFLNIPTFKPSQREILPSIIKSNESSWLKEIVNLTIKKQKDNRAVLIICGSINELDKVNLEFLQQSQIKPLIYKYSHQILDFDAIDSQVLLSTNLAGRGTDLKITEQLGKRGGLHVILTYMPQNIRIQEQAFGRVARKGDPGTAQFIILDETYEDGQVVEIEMSQLMSSRDNEELQRIRKFKQDYDLQLTLEEEFFSQFSLRFQELKKELTEVQKNLKIVEIYLESFINQWAFWLFKYSNHISKVSCDSDKQQIRQEFQIFLKNSKHNYINTCDPVSKFKLGKIYFTLKEYNKSLKIFEDVINSEDEFIAEAYYYGAAAYMNRSQSFSDQKKAREWFKKSKIILQSNLEIFMSYTTIIKLCSVYYSYGKELTEQENQYQVQKIQQTSIYHAYIQSIDQILGIPLMQNDFVCATISDEQSKQIYDLIKNKTQIIKTA